MTVGALFSRFLQVVTPLCRVHFASVRYVLPNHIFSFHVFVTLKRRYLIVVLTYLLPLIREGTRVRVRGLVHDDLS